MMDGIPAKFLIEARIILVSIDGFAYSFRYIAQATPKGTANSVVIKVSNTVPTMAGSIPPLVIPSVGNDDIKFQDKLEYPFEKISHNITPKNKQTMNVLPERRIQLNVLIKFFLFIRRGIFLSG